jgi:hypothetical protein
MLPAAIAHSSFLSVGVPAHCHEQSSEKREMCERDVACGIAHSSFLSMGVPAHWHEQASEKREMCCLCRCLSLVLERGCTGSASRAIGRREMCLVACSLPIAWFLVVCSCSASRSIVRHVACAVAYCSGLRAWCTYSASRAIVRWCTNSFATLSFLRA